MAHMQSLPFFARFVLLHESQDYCHDPISTLTSKILLEKLDISQDLNFYLNHKIVVTTPTQPEPLEG